jgi:formylglycine-generating enzyme
MKYALALVIAFALFFPLTVGAITIDTVPIGNSGNTGDIQSNGIFGRVTADYRIAMTEITNSQYVTFLNAVAVSDPFALYNTNMDFYSRGGITRTGAPGGYSYSVKPDATNVDPGGITYTYGDKPVVFVSFFDAIRFANWVNNGATAGAATETGAYTLANGNTVARNAGAVWFLPNENQWYKAAYYDGATGSYYDYPTESNAPPNNNPPSSDTNNSANYYASDYTTLNGSYPMTPVGAYSLSKSPYGTSDQGGNVWEWTETAGTSTTRIRRGGSSDTDFSTLNAAHREPIGLTSENETLGFRLATIATTSGLPGDYNANNVVEAGDYVLWRKYSGQSITLPNDSTPGSVTPGDYDVWRAHFGLTSSGSGSGSLLQSTVPEPPMLPLLGTVAFIMLCRRKLN